ncbi:MAG: LamG domain-containing protein [Candidatus Latescibacteria bacterium]|nr:LamG domain-containing protein [Candidatus Latescibacterota bacterium]
MCPRDTSTERVLHPGAEGQQPLKLDAALTVEAWVRSEEARAEAMQVIAVQWELRSQMDCFETYDAGDTEGLRTQGYFGAVFDGRYVYFAPQYDGQERHGKVLRCDTAGQGACFVLKYMDCGHNGGLCGALPGPSFAVNTAGGIRNARANRNPGPGWHHLAGVYDGALLALFIDGELAGQGGGGGPLAPSQAAIQVGELATGCSRFRGEILQVRVANIARPASWIQEAYQQFKASVSSAER